MAWVLIVNEAKEASEPDAELVLRFSRVLRWGNADIRRMASNQITLWEELVRGPEEGSPE